MSWEITGLFVDSIGAWGIELTNVSGGPLSTSDFGYRLSNLTSDTAPYAPFSFWGGPIIVPDGGSFVFGDTDLAEVDLGGGGFAALNSGFDFFGVTDTGNTLIDSIGDSDSGAVLGNLDTIYSAKTGRAVDVNATDDFDISDDFDSSSPYCFAAGTLIATRFGERAVEDLRIGDLIVAADGGSIAVKWLGVQAVKGLVRGPRLQPVRIRAGALAEGIPHTDLTVTADHGMIVHGLVINASALVNGGSIDWVPWAELPDQLTYYHIETEEHDVVLANGAPAETFVDYAGRQGFDNYQEYVDLYGAERIITEMDRSRISTQRLLPEAITARLGILEPQTDRDALLTA